MKKNIVTIFWLILSFQLLANVATAQVTTRNAHVGEKVILDVTKESAGAKCQWYTSKDAENLEWTLIKGATKPVYSVGAVKASQNGYAYRCSFNGDNSSDSYIVLNIKAKPKIKTQPKAVTIFNGQDFPLKLCPQMGKNRYSTSGSGTMSLLRNGFLFPMRITRNIHLK